MRLLVDGGMLVSSSCSYNVGEAEFESETREIALDGLEPGVALLDEGPGVGEQVLLGAADLQQLDGRPRGIALPAVEA